MTVRGKIMGAATTAEMIAAVIEAAVAGGDAVAGEIAGDVRKAALGEGTCHPRSMLRHRAANPVVTIIAAGSAAATTIAVRKRHVVLGLHRRIRLKIRFSFRENLSRNIAANR
jgi:hypothetical protein